MRFVMPHHNLAQWSKRGAMYKTESLSLLIITMAMWLKQLFMK